MPNRFAIIEADKVINTVVAEPDYAVTQGWISLPEGVGVGWDHTNGQFIDNRPASPASEPAPAPTKEQLMAELAALTAKIQALE